MFTRARLAWTLGAALTLVAMAAQPAGAQPAQPGAAPRAPRFTFSGLVFGDFYYFGQHHDDAWEGQDGFWFRRIYATFDYQFTPKVETRLRFEMNSDGALGGGLLTPYVKDVWLRWTFYGRQQLTLGMQPSVGIDHADSLWGLRHIEKSPVDLYRWDSSRDTGLSVSGPLNAESTLTYEVQFGNDSKSGSESDRFKDLRAALWYEPAPGFIVEAMYGYFAHDRHADWSIAQAMAGYRGRRARGGLQFASQHRRAPDPSRAPAQRLEIYSGFVVADAKPQKLSLFARVDRHADPCPGGESIGYLPIDPTAPFTLVLAGVEYYLLPAVRFSPNVEWVRYSAPREPGLPRPGNDLVWRATFFWAW